MIDYRDASSPIDLGQLARLFESVGWNYRTADPERFARMVHGSPYRVAAYDAEALIGFARAIPDGAFNAYVSTVVVSPAYQRQGVGRQLVERLLEGRDDEQFVLHADAPVHPFYLKCGFRLAPDMLRRDRRR